MCFKVTVKKEIALHTSDDGRARYDSDGSSPMQQDGWRKGSVNYRCAVTNMTAYFVHILGDLRLKMVFSHLLQREGHER